MSYTFKVEDIFHDIPGDPENVMMTIPPEVLEETGWKEGDTLVITLEDQTLCITKKDNG